MTEKKPDTNVADSINLTKLWNTLPDTLKLVLILAGGAYGVVEMKTSVDRMETRLQETEQTVSELVRHVQYLSCREEQKDEGREPQRCAVLLNPREF